MKPNKKRNHAEGWGYYWVHPAASRAVTDCKVALWEPRKNSWFFVGDEKAHDEHAVDEIIEGIELPGSFM